MGMTGTYNAAPTAIQIETYGEQNPRSVTLIHRGTADAWFGFTQAGAEARTGVGPGKGVKMAVGDTVTIELLASEQLWVSCASGTQRIESFQTDARTYAL